MSVARPLSRSASVSPMQISGIRPWRTAASVFRPTVSSVSPKCSRRSEWPSSTMSRLQSLSMTGEISPVQAPWSAQCMFCAPTLTEVSASRRLDLAHGGERRNDETLDRRIARAIGGAQRLGKAAGFRQRLVHLPAGSNPESRCGAHVVSQFEAMVRLMFARSSCSVDGRLRGAVGDDDVEIGKIGHDMQGGMSNALVIDQQAGLARRRDHRPLWRARHCRPCDRQGCRRRRASR